MQEASALVEGKECPKCGSKLVAKDVSWTGDLYGWKLDDNGFPMTAIVHCPDDKCRHQFGMRDLGFDRPQTAPKYVM